ncbi:MAG: class I tRNA ligase family protein [Candidatus Paceibacterota bacterium]|jgi:isoleucyl-tRNA synthetase
MESTKSDVAKREEEILQFWQEDKTFEKSLKKKSPKGNYVFYDGPPFATGTPHYGHILGSTAKDVIGRYKTMQGYHVPRRWGWDCHGLPIENIVEKDLKISGRKAIEEYGIEKFTEYARSKVLTYVHEWKKTIDRIGRWVDFDNSYKTMDNSFIESVWWALGELNKKGLIYEGVRVLAYCPRCETPIANSEIAMDNSYKDITDISVYAKFELKDEPKTYFLAWTTTPWTLPGNIALAVNPEVAYVKIKHEGQYLILAKERLVNTMKDKPYELIEEFEGKTFIGKKYTPLFDYYTHTKGIADNEKSWTVRGAEFVTTTDGTGIVHIAPAFGEDDMNMAKAEGLPWIIHVTPTGKFTDEVTHFAGQQVKPKENHQAADVEIIKYLAHNHLLFEKEKIIHSYPHCYRCETPLYYYALPSWFVNIQKEKSHILSRAEEMAWIPAHLKEGRFKGGVESAPDWTISRNRYWASPLPIWKSKSGKVMFVNSLEDLKNKTKKSGNTYHVMRHGEAENNVKKIVSYADQKNSHLTPKGKEETMSTAKTVAVNKITKIFCSPFTRTLETAYIVADELGISRDNIVTDVRLWELNAGTFDGKKWAEWEVWAKSQENYYNARPEGGESHFDAKKRFGDFIYDIDSQFHNESILVVTHGIGLEVLPAVVECADGVRSKQIYENTSEKTGAMIELEFTPLPHTANYELDFHRPYIDAIKLVDEAGEEYTRITEVIDCWFESGSMPFAQDHYPFERKNWQKENFPAGFVAEYIAQTRTWFYYTHALSTIFFDHAPFQNVITTGNILAEDGQKMSKSKGNFPDPALLFDKYSVDALRLYLMSSTLMKGEDMNFFEKGVDEVNKKVIMRLGNVLSFYKLYSDFSSNSQLLTPNSSHVLDQWMFSRLGQLVTEVTTYMELYELDKATRPLFDFVDDLSTWYLRRSRDRFKSDDVEDREAALQTTRYVLETTAKLVAPLMPFIAEYIYKELGNSESVHLADWPGMGDGSLEIGDRVIQDMVLVRKVASLGLEARAKEKIAVRQPLAKLELKDATLEGKTELLELIKDEVNVKQILFNKELESEVKLDTVLTDELKQEGELRELMRAVQDLRKTKGLEPGQVIRLTLSKSYETLAKKFETELKKGVRAEKIVVAETAEMSLEVV